jgi:hypothetical protein
VQWPDARSFHRPGGPAAHRSAHALLQKYGAPAATCTARDRTTYV